MDERRRQGARCDKRRAQDRAGQQGRENRRHHQPKRQSRAAQGRIGGASPSPAMGEAIEDDPRRPQQSEADQDGQGPGDAMAGFARRGVEARPLGLDGAAEMVGVGGQGVGELAP